MELVSDGSLDDQRARFGDVAWALPLLRQIVDGLAALHAAGVMHRDLKPPNVLLAGAPGGVPVAKICDFGISRMGTTDGEGLPLDADAARGHRVRVSERVFSGGTLGLSVPSKTTNGLRENRERARAPESVCTEASLVERQNLADPIVFGRHDQERIDEVHWDVSVARHHFNAALEASRVEWNDRRVDGNDEPRRRLESAAGTPKHMGRFDEHALYGDHARTKPVPHGGAGRVIGIGRVDERDEESGVEEDGPSHAGQGPTPPSPPARSVRGPLAGYESHPPSGSSAPPGSAFPRSTPRAPDRGQRAPRRTASFLPRGHAREGERARADSGGW
jgi:hypothetical protein